MPFIPHTEADIQRMLDTIGVASIDDLFDEIPENLRCRSLDETPTGISEMEITALMQQRACEDGQALCFIGAGAYDHHIPAAVWQIATRGGFYSAYTPHHAEASQGTLQLLYEYQSMMTALTAMDVSNASLYDGASALAEAVPMAVRGNPNSKSRRILVSKSLHPSYRAMTRAIVVNQGIELVELPFDTTGGHTDVAGLEQYAGEDIAAVVIAQPNFFGVLEDVDEMTDWAHAIGALVIGVVNPVAMAILDPPGNWGGKGVDICCGEGQPLGVPLSSGGPNFGFLCCTRALVRQMSGQLVGKTVDLDGNPGYTLALQAREQHTERSDLTSNILTHQGLVVTAATIHMALLGAEGLARVGAACHANMADLVAKLTEIDGVSPRFDRPVFHEQVLRLPTPASGILRSLAAHNVLGGYDLKDDYPELGDAILVCATEMRTASDIKQYSQKMARLIATRTQAKCPVEPKFNV